jgi:hypothetical protein
LRKFTYTGCRYVFSCDLPILLAAPGAASVAGGQAALAAVGSLLVAAVAATAAVGARLGGGRGSFDAGLPAFWLAGFQAGDGERRITELAPAAPELSSLAMVGTGPAGLTGLTGHAASIKGLKRGGVLARAFPLTRWTAATKGEGMRVFAHS